MSFCYINEGYKRLFNFIQNDTSVTQVESSTFNPDSTVGCTATSPFGIMFDNTLSDIYGKFSFYVNSDNPAKSVFKMSFYNLESADDISQIQIPNIPICSLEGYPSDSELLLGYFPLILNVNRVRIFASSTSDVRKCTRVNEFSTIWFHLKLATSGYHTFEIRVNEHPVYTYSFGMSLETLGNAILFDLGSDTILSNIILSDSSIDPAEKIIPLVKTFTSGTAEVIDDTYCFTTDGQNVKFSLSNSSLPTDYNTIVSRIACRVTPIENIGAAEFKTIKFRDTAVTSTYSTASLPAVGSTHTFVTNINKTAAQANVSRHSAEIVLNV